MVTKKPSNKNALPLLIMWALALIPLIVGLIIIPRLPSNVPLHYGPSGMVDGWGSPYTLLIIASSGAVLVGFASFFLLRKTQAVAPARKPLMVTTFTVLVMINAIFAIQMYLVVTNVTNLQAPGAFGVNFFTYLSGIFSLVMIPIGNIMPKAQPNSFVGVRTPWAFSNEEIWRKTQRFGGKLLFGGGVLGILITVLVGGVASFITVLAFVLLAALIAILYSYYLFKQAYA